MIHSAQLSNDVILDVNNVWKIYCRNLKKAMWYGIRDFGREMIGAGRDRSQSDLRRGEFFAVRDASFQLKQGECLAMIGPNGAGKSSMLKMVNGLIRPDAGQITLKGKTGALIELGSGFNPILSGRENVYINASVLGMKKAEVDRYFDKIVEFAELGHVIDDPIKSYSTGMRMRLGFSVAANLRPQLLIMDEVLAVGDVGFRMKCFAHLNEIVKSGVSIVIVTHAVGMLQRIASRSVVFGQGKIVFDGELETGITVYEEMMTVSNENQMKKDERTHKPVASINTIEVQNDLGEKQTEFETGDSVKLRVQLNCKKTLKNARLVVALSSPIHGTLFSTSTAYQDVQFDLESGGDSVTLTFERIPLMIGAYYFNVSLYGREMTDFYDRRSGQGNFRVTGPPTNSAGMGINGLVKMRHDWSVGE